MFSPELSQKKALNGVPLWLGRGSATSSRFAPSRQPDRRIVFIIHGSSFPDVASAKASACDTP